MRSRSLAIMVMVLALVSAGCTGGGGDDPGGARADEGAKGSGASGGDAVEAAAKWLDGWDELDRETRAALVQTRVVEREGVTHVRFAQVYHGTPVRGAEVVVHVDGDGDVAGATSSLADVDAPPKVEEKVDEARAKAIASKTATEPTAGDPAAKVVWLQDGKQLRLGWSVNLATETADARGAWTVWVDAVTGAVADAHEYSLSAGAGGGAPPRAQASGPACRLDRAPSACVFAPDPVADPRRLPDQSETEDLLFAQPLLGLRDSSGRSLVGEFVDLEPDGVTPVRDDDGKWDAGRGQPGFEAAMAYFWIDRTQRELQRLGLTGIRDEPFPVVAVDPKVKNNAFYSGAQQAIFLGVMDNGTNFGEDAVGIIHEYGHAVLDEQVPGLLSASGGKAYHEAFGDLLGLLVTLEADAGGATCIFPWLIGKCARRLDTGNTFPDDLANEEHIDSQIYSSAVFQILTQLLEQDDLTLDDCADDGACNEVRDRVLKTLLASNEFLTSNVGLPEIAASYVRANEVLFDGDDERLIEAAFAEHGLGEGGPANVDRSGRRGSGAEVAVSIDVTHPSRGQLNVFLGVLDGEFERKCETLTVLAADPSDELEDLRGVVDVSDTDCAEHVPPSPDDQWVLVVQDTVSGQAGRIDGFRVIVDGRPFLATGVPEPIADADPDGSSVILNGGTTEVDSEDEEDLGDAEEDEEETAAGGPTAFIDISHAHVGDLAARAGVADAEGTVLCSVEVLDPDPNEDAPGVEGEVDLSKCARFYPPGPNQQWFLEVVDEAADDEGTVDAFRLDGPNGQHRSSPASAPIPDDDEDGLVLFITR